MDRRMYTRVTLRHPIPCTCQVGQDEPMQASVVNVSTMGIMIEVPDIKDKLTIDCCQSITVGECDMEGGCLFAGMVGITNWLYKNYIGIGFEHPIKGSNKELRAWLKELGQLCEEAS